MSGPTVTLVVAMARNGVIGRDGDMPWRLPSDLKRFKALTLGKPVVMGRKTWASIGARALPGRLNVVVTRDAAFIAQGAVIAPSLAAALALSRNHAVAGGAGEICVIGGGEIYRQAMPLADTLQVTEVQAEIAGDTLFPSIETAIFEKTADDILPGTDKDSHPMRAITWRRRIPV